MTSKLEKRMDIYTLIDNPTLCIQPPKKENMKKIIIAAIFLTTSIWGLKAQQDAQYTQYMYNAIAVNPAYAGSRGGLSIAALHRSQWLGLDGAPTTRTLNIHSPVSERVGLGLSVVNDEIGNGVNQDTYFDGVFSYIIPISIEGKLSFGVKAGGHFLNIDFNQLQNFEPTLTQSGEFDIDRKFSPNFGAGIYYHTERLYAGLSVPNFLQTQHFDASGNNSTFLAQERMNWYLIAGYVFDLNTYLKLKPTVLFRAVEGAPLQMDLSTNLLLNDKFSFGLAYRWNAAFSALAGFQIDEKLMLGLAYDREITELGNTAFNNGSFEIFLRFELLNRYKNAVTPRFF